MGIVQNLTQGFSPSRRAVLAGGGSCSLRIDAQGKTLGQALLEMPVDLPPALLPT